MARYFEYRHTVSFEETNLLANAYFTHFIRWQGLCREKFLKDHTPDIPALFAGGFRLVTLKCSCDYFSELKAFDEVAVRMRLSDLVQNRMVLSFEYLGHGPQGEVLVARGEQHIASMTLRDGRLEPSPWPSTLLDALRPYGGPAATDRSLGRAGGAAPPSTAGR
jgi:enediyne biosynthesis thioesterase